MILLSPPAARHPRRLALAACLLIVITVLWGLLPAGAAAATSDPSGFSVVGGQTAATGRWPSVVALVRQSEPDDVAGQLCGGTAIAPDLVLTAAHCFHDRSGHVVRAPDQMRVVAGRTDLSASGGTELQGTEVYVHPSYDARRHRNDLAVLRVGGDLGVPAQVMIGAQAAGPFEGDQATVVGWGRTGQGDEGASRQTSQLHEATVPITDDAGCRQAYQSILDLRVHLCAGGGGSADWPAADACTGDSGGPLLVRQPNGEPVQIGITSFGPDNCGVGEPGVYSRVAAMRDFVDEVLAGAVAPTILPGADVTLDAPGVAVRIHDGAAPPTDIISQAVAASRAVFDAGRAELAILARDDGFADALAGSSLGYGRGPLLFTSSSGPLDGGTQAELLRAVQPGATIYLLGGQAAVPLEVEEHLHGLGFAPVRLAGATREETAAAVAAEVVRRHGGGRTPFGTVVLVTAQAWPDAVLAGQLGAWWGYPILLTPAEELHGATATALSELAPRRLLVVGGLQAIADSVVGQVTGLLPDLQMQRLAGHSRIETGVAIARWHRDELVATGEPAPDAVVAVNVRRQDGYAHVLAATPLLGATAGVFLPVDGEGGDVLTPEVKAAFCGVGGLPLVIGSTDLVAQDVADRMGPLVAGTDCS
ncbi:MAG TPA: trypsin-like serine protease [Euzebya sp.]|nr:trypsin-like serine protease [Euzebya sp.]